MAALPPPGKDHLSKVPGETLKIVGEMSPDLLIQGQKTNKAIRKALEREDIWNAIAQKMGIPIQNRFDVKRELTSEVLNLNELLKQYLPSPQSTDPFGRYAEYNAHIAAHSKEKTMVEAFQKLMDELSSGASVLNAIKMFIKNGMLRNPGVPWERYLMQALGEKYLGENSFANTRTPCRYPEAFALILQEYLATKPSSNEQDKLFKALGTVIIVKANTTALEQLITAGLKVDQKMLDTIIGWEACRNSHCWLTTELMFRSMLRSAKMDSKNALSIVDAYEEGHMKRNPHFNTELYKKTFQFFREVISNPAILRQNPTTMKTIHEWVQNTSGTSERSRLELLSKSCTPEDKVQLLALIEAEEQKALKKIEGPINKYASAAEVEQQQIGCREHFKQIKQIFK